MTSLTTKESNELLDKAKFLNISVENDYLDLCDTMSEIEESGAFKEAGYDTFMDYAMQDLGRSKGVISRMVKVGTFRRVNSFQNETKGISYSRLYLSINAHKDESPEYIVAAAQTNTESELIISGNQKSVPKHEGVFDICSICKNNKFNHD